MIKECIITFEELERNIRVDSKDMDMFNPEDIRFMKRIQKVVKKYNFKPVVEAETPDVK